MKMAKLSFLLTALVMFSSWRASAQTNVVLTRIASFNLTNGAYLWSGLVQGSDGNFYGTTEAGGENTNWPPAFLPGPGYGTVFKVTPGGELTRLASFMGSNGIAPTAGLVEGPDSAFYGTAWYGGTSNLGVVFKATTNGQLTALCSFVGSNGASPRGALAFGKDGCLYGTTRYGGTYGQGTIFKITTNGVLTSLHSFANGTDAYQPMSALVLARDGAFYSTGNGGIDNHGALFKLAPDGTVTTVAAVDPSLGWASYSGCILGSDGRFYIVSGGGPPANGGVYCITMNAQETSLLTFPTNRGVGFGALVEGADGNFYSVLSGSPPSTWGSIFRMTPGGSYTELATFNGTNGYVPRSALIQAKDGDFYGTAAVGGAEDGSQGYGTIFRVHIPLADSPGIRSISKAGETTTLTWGALVGRNYQLQSCSNLASSDWQDLGAQITATNSLATTSDTNATDAQKFYRVALLP
jgi:uncharacterized repeat protein (TIGR03803 family)